MATSDNNMMLNQAQEVLISPSRAAPSVIDFSATLPGVENLLIKVCKQHKQRFCTFVPHHLVVLMKKDLASAGFVKEWKVSSRTQPGQKLVLMTL